MMKKIISIISAAVCFAILAGCGTAADNGRNLNSQTTVNDILASGIAAENSAASPESSAESDTVSISFSDWMNDDAESAEIDVDLTTQSATVVYSTVFDMMSMPEKYLRKTIKMTGSAVSSTDENTGKTYHACIIKDATACCSQGIEYILDDESAYPADGETITVIGEFSTYNEGKFQYSTLKKAKLAG